MRNRIRTRVAGCLALILTLLACGPSVLAQTSKALPSGLDYAEVEQAIADYVEDHAETTAGLAVAVLDREQVIHESYYGHADVEAGRTATAETVFEWGSITKLMIWVSLMQLEEQGLVDLESDVRDYVASERLVRVPESIPITLLDLMNHQAGFQDTLVEFFTDDAEFTTLEEALDRMAPPLIYTPGEVTAYSNWGTALAAHVVEEVSGLSFADYVHDKIFTVLGMEQTALLPDLSDQPWVQAQSPLTVGYTAGVQALPDLPRQIPLYPAGQATGTLGDLMRFAAALLPGADRQTALFQDHATLSKLLSPTAYYTDTDVPRVSHGFWNLVYETPVLGHLGNTLGQSSALHLEPESGVAMIVLTNQVNEAIYTQELPELIFGPTSASPHVDADVEVPSGFFRSARTIRQGPLMLYSFLMQPLRGERLAGYHNLTEIGPEGKQLLVEEPYNDLLQVPTDELVIAFVLVLSLVLTLVYLLVSLVLGIVRLIRRKKRLDLPREHRRRHVRNQVLLWIYALNMIGFYFLVASFQPAEWIRRSLILFTVLALVFLVLVSQAVMRGLMAQGDTPVLPRRQRVQSVLESVLLFLAACFMLYGQLFRFGEL